MAVVEWIACEASQFSPLRLLKIAPLTLPVAEDGRMNHILVDAIKEQLAIYTTGDDDAGYRFPDTYVQLDVKDSTMSIPFILSGTFCDNKWTATLKSIVQMNENHPESWWRCVYFVNNVASVGDSER